MNELRPEHISRTRRYARLASLEAYYNGTQYDGRPDFWSGGVDEVPIRERAPCIVYPLPKAATNQATRFLFGDGRFPTIAVNEVSEEDAPEAHLGLSEDEAKVLTTYLGSIAEQCGLRSAMRQLARKGLSTGTAVAVLSLRKGRFEVDATYSAKDCLPVFGPCNELVSLTVCYEFDKLVPDDSGEPRYVRHYFRRDITADDVLVYHDEPVEVGVSPDWQVDAEASVHHGFGFCPAVWIPNLGDGGTDGVSLYEDLEDEFDALNLALSQRHRGLVYFGTPQAYETGVSKSEDIASPARTARPARVKSGPGEGAEGGAFGVTATKKARRKAPDEVWSYEAPDVKLGIIETTGKAFEVASLHVADVRARILEAIDVVLLDPTTVAGKGDISAKALSYLYAPLLALVDELRECWWTHGLSKILSLMLRMTAHLGGAGILLPRAKQAGEILRRFLVTFDGETVWAPPTMTPTWGDYFSPSNGEIFEAVKTADKAKGGLISAETATRYVASYFGVTDVELEREDIDDAAEEAAEAFAPTAPSTPAVVGESTEPKEPVEAKDPK